MNEQTIFTAAIERDPAERAAFLDGACGADHELRERVEKLIGLHEVADKFFERPATGACPTVEQPLLERSGTQIGPYKLLQQIGEGGMGTVFMAQQTHPVQRMVALKVIKAGMDSRQVIARFEAERQALAMMDHVNIVRVLDAGATESGQPYFVMELVHGVPITKYCDDNHLTPRQRLELFVPVCQAIQHAHQKGIIHRDIKPSNVMVTLYDGKPVPKVIDFGVAKAIEQRLTERTLFTQYGNIVGTLEYMSPEQAEMSALGVDTRSDIFSLGVLLYELLTGTTPLSHKRVLDAAYGEVLRMIRDEEPPKPSTRLSESGEALASISAQRQMEPSKLAKLVRGELDWIVMKCLEKDRNRRYETANGFAADVQRYLSDQPVEACPHSAIYRFKKFARRHRVGFTTATVVLVAIVLGAVVSATQAIRARRAEQLAETRLQAEAEAHNETEHARQAEIAQRQISEAQRTEAEKMRQQAEANFRKAQQAVDEYLTLVSESKLFDVPGLQPLRKQLLEAALRYYQGFLDQRSSDPNVRAELAAAYLRVAHISEQISRSDDAILALQRGLDVVDELLQKNPPLADLPKQLAGVRKGGRIAHMWEAWPSDIPGAVRTYQKAAEIWERLARENPTKIDLRSDLAAFYWRIGDLQWGTQSFVEALSAFQKACQIWEKLALENPIAPEYRADLAESLDHVGKVLVNTGRSAESEAAYRKSLVLREKLVADFPNLPDYRAGLANSLGRFASALRAYGRQDEAEETFRKSIELWEKLAAEFPNFPAYRKILAETNSGLGTLFTETRRMQQAEDAFRRGLGIQRKLAAEFPGDEGDSVTNLVELLTRLANLLVDSGQRDEADKAYREALNIYDTLTAKFPDHPKYRWSSANCHRQYASWLNGLGRSQEAEKSCRRSLELNQKLADDFPDNIQYRYDAGWSCDLLSHVLQSSNHLQEAVEVCRAAVKFLQSVSTDRPSLPVYRDNVANEYCRLANLLHAAGKSQEAEDAFRRSLELSTELADQHPDSLGYRSAVANVHGEIANFFANTGRPKEADEARRDQVAALEKLLKEIPAAPENRLTLAWLHNGLGWDLRNHFQDRQLQAEQEHRLSLALLEHVVTDSPSGPLYRVERSEILHAIATLMCDRGDLAGAKPLTVQATDDAQNALQSARHDDATCERLCRDLRAYAIVFVRLDEPATAADTLRVVLADWEARAPQSASEPGYRKEAAQSYLELARLEQNHGRFEAGQKSYRRGIEVFQKLTADFPNLSEYRTLLSQSRNELIEILIAQSKHAEAAKLTVELPQAGQVKWDEYQHCLEYLHRCQALAQKDHSLSQSEQNATAEGYAKRADELLDEAIKRGTATAESLNSLAWRLATSPDPQLRDAVLAIELAKKGIELLPQERDFPRTLGAAYFRAGNWKAAIESLQKSMELGSGGDGFDWFFLAMTQWQSDHKEEARTWYDKAVEWMDKNKPQDEELQRFRAEATELLGITNPHPPKDSSNIKQHQTQNKN